MKLRVRISRCEDGGYVASCPALPGCITRGNTTDQARENMHEAIRCYIASISDFVPENITDEVVVEV
ncbi:MAG: type II toxin-antitoxin system HicB family antitoxin [Planctomycetes bacterium]|nr:type II toxin-antitoxin system HicB family antitoxin [Planctomycetota bacterium]